MKEINKNIRKVDTKLSIAEVNKIAKETAKALGSDFSVTKDSVDTASFDLDYMGEEYDGGSYIIMDNGDVVNVALPEKQVAYNYKTNKKFEFGGDFQAGVYAGGGGVGLIGNQKRIDMNHNGKIDAEDFKILRSTMNGAWRNERKHVNHSEDYEVRYAKPRPKRTGYKGKRKFDDGGGVEGKDTWQNIFEEYGFKKGRSKYGLDMYYKRGYTGYIDKNLRNVDLMFEDNLLYKGYSVRGLLDVMEHQFGKRKFDDGGKVTSFTNKDGIRVRSKVEPKEKMSEKEWMAKHNSSKEARNYMAGGKTSSKKEAIEVKKGKGNHKMKATTDLAKKIRKEGEKWTDAIKRASQQMKIN